MLLTENRKIFIVPHPYCMELMGKSQWQPTKIEYVMWTGIKSSTSPARVLTDQGVAYFKAMGNTAGSHVLACEFVGTSLAKLLKLSTFDFCIFLYTGDSEIIWKNGNKAEKGAGFMTKEEFGLTWDGCPDFLKYVKNKGDITKLICLDTWIRNQDRYYAHGQIRTPRRNYDNIFLSGTLQQGFTLKVFDFTHAFTNGRDVTKKEFGITAVKDGTIYGNFPEFGDYFDVRIAKKTLNQFKAIQKADIRLIIETIPKEWDISNQIRNEWIEFLLQRADFISENFLQMWRTRRQTSLPLEEN